MLKNFSLLGLKKGDILVSDGWKATLSALAAHRRKHRLSNASLRHEIVNHSPSEIVNKNGFSTNAIEAKWSIMKRWIRQRMGSKIPSHSDRAKWRLLIDEFQARALLKGSASHSLDRGNFSVVRFSDVAKLFRIA